jgi:hypothetical protein
MTERDHTNGRADLLLLERVRCLGCGSVYSKPAGGGTASSNPGCPDCGYVGWVSMSLLTEAALPIRFGVGPLRHRPA